MKQQRILLSCKFPMRIIAVFVITFLISATVLYFYDTLVAAFEKLKDIGIFTENFRIYISLMMAIIIGLGILAESAPTIWDKLQFWGQCLDNKIIKYQTGKTYFLDESHCLLEQTRILINQTNFNLQKITMSRNFKLTTAVALRDLDLLYQLRKSYEKIKNNCIRIHNLLELNEAYDRINKEKQTQFKNTLNRLINDNLQIGDRIEILLIKLEKYHKT